MNRSARRHRSTKVPNVKLRPAPSKEDESNTSKSAADQDWEAEQEAMRHYRALRVANAAGKQRVEESQDDEEEDEDDDYEGHEKDADDRAPLSGCVICTTGFDEEKVSLHECAVALGATVEGNLTESTTHLIANKPGSDKYYWAIKLGMPVLRPLWLYDLRKRWRKAEPINFDDLIEEHRLDTFEELTMGMAGVMEIEKRKEIRQQIKAAGGLTPQTFKLDGSFTHLLCEDVKYSETLQIVQKYLKKAERYIRRGVDIPDSVSDASTMRAAIKIKLVWIDWLEDCLAVQGCIKEELYSINRPRPTTAQRTKIVQSIETRRKETSQRIASNMKMFKASLSDLNTDLSKMKNQEHNIPRPATKRPNIALNMLMEQIGQSSTGSSILKESTPLDDRSSNHTGDSITVETARVPEKEYALIEKDKQANDSAVPVENDTFLSGPNDQSVASEQMDISVSSSKRDRMEEKDPFMSKKDSTEKDLEDEHDEDDLKIDESAGLFSTHKEKSLQQMCLRIDLRDESKNQKVFDALQKQGFTKLLKAQDPQTADFHVLPLAKVDVDPLPHLGNPVTHFFIERCLMEGRIIRMDESFVLQPATCNFPLPDSTLVHVATTGLGSNEDGPDRHQIEMALEVAGIKVSSIFKKGVHTHLLVGKKAEGSSSSDVKIDRAKKWGVPIVGVDFVEQIYRKGEISPSPSVAKSVSSTSLSRDQSGIDLMDISTTSERASTTLRETQASDFRSTILRSQNVNNNGESKEIITGKVHPGSPKTTKRPWQRVVSSNVPKKTEDAINGLMKENGRKSEPPLDSQGKMHDKEPQQSMDMDTQVIRYSSNQMVELLNGHLLERSTSGQGSNRRRLPASIRNRMRMKSRTPNSEECTDNGKGEECDITVVEEMLTRRREEEGDAEAEKLNEAQATQNPFAYNPEIAESMRVVYDDPVARRERRKMAAMINNSKRNAEGREDESVSNDKSPTKRVTNNQSPASKRARTSITGFSPSMKARKQPGTAMRDS